MRVTINVVAVLIALVALIAMIDWVLVKFGMFLYHNLHFSQMFLGFDLTNLSMKMIVGKVFAILPILWECRLTKQHKSVHYWAKKFILNETIAYIDLVSIKNIISQKSFVIASFAFVWFLQT
ncbi:MAG: hypothetical protein L6V95_11665 [Candidatus Melainabacteria bacterium]|nr:MAG: hypothetical protein L6V95_11665 [Candidatus Melainabacteria bacterium]